MEGEEDMEIDPSIAAAMGFSSFGSKPGEKRKYNSNDGYVDPAISTQDEDSATGSSHADKTINVVGNHVNNSENKEEILAATVTAKTPAEATLEELKNGVRNENGDVVYFMPSFLEDPWKDLEPK